MTFEFEESEKLDPEGEDFLTRNWALIEGPDGGMARSKGVTIAVRDGNEIVGVLKAWHAGGVGYVTELMIAPDRRSHGLGGELLRRFEETSRKAHCFRLALRVECDSPAKRFYEREGWQVELTVDNWLNGHRYAQMRKDLN